MTPRTITALSQPRTISRVMFSIGSIMATFSTAFFTAGMSLFTKLVTDSFAEKVLSKVVIAGLEWSAKRTTNTVDDELVQEVQKRFNKE